MFKSWRHQLWLSPVIGVIREVDLDQARYQVDLAVTSGIKFIEITTVVPHYLDLIQQLRTRYPQVWIGAGTILDSHSAAEAIGGGSQFLVSPILNLTVVNLAQAHQIPVIPGALTPNEIWQALQLGVPAVKVFPIDSLGGSPYIQRVCKPLGDLPLIPTGGVTTANSLEFLAAGALAVGIGSDLFPQSLQQAQKWNVISERIQSLMQSTRQLRATQTVPNY